MQPLLLLPPASALLVLWLHCNCCVERLNPATLLLAHIPSSPPPPQTFFSNALAAVGGTTAGPGLSVVNVYLNYEKKFAFVEFRTVEEASNAMALDGIMFEGGPVRWGGEMGGMGRLQVPHVE